MKEVHKPSKLLNMVVVTDGNGDITTSNKITTTELNMLNNVRTNIQTQLDGKLSTLVGEVKYYAGTSVPSGYLLCDGSAVSRTTYANLFAAIGTTWGAGDGSTTFNVPNLIDRVPWGGRTGGVYREAGLPNITGQIERGYASHETSNGALSSGMGGVGSLTGTDTNARILRLDASKSNSIYGKSSTVQPPAAVIMPIIKY